MLLGSLLTGRRHALAKGCTSLRNLFATTERCDQLKYSHGATTMPFKFRRSIFVRYLAMSPIRLSGNATSSFNVACIGLVRAGDVFTRCIREHNDRLKDARGTTLDSFKFKHGIPVAVQSRGTAALSGK